jgi:hypothetical protein
MHLSLARIILWGSRLLVVMVALWWPGLWRDPIYTPRQARLAGHELQLPDGTIPTTPEERAMATFWMWEQRTLVTTQWVTGPYLGLRNPQGWRQTLLVMFIIWSVGSGALLLMAWLAPNSFAQQRRKTGVRDLLVTPLWRLLTQRRVDHRSL